MKSICSLYKIGRGPSSSHTMGPERVCKELVNRYPNADHFQVVLYGSLAFTGEGHGTKQVITETLAPASVEIVDDRQTKDLPHPNTMLVTAFHGEELLGQIKAMSIGGGDIRLVGEDATPEPDVYPEATFSQIARFCHDRGIRLYEYAEQYEGTSLTQHMAEVWETMRRAIQNGIQATGLLPGNMHVARKAKRLYDYHHIDERPETKESRLVCSYAFAVGEENASGGTIVTAPTCGASGVVPAVLYYYQQMRSFSDAELYHALETAGVMGNLIRTNASISGAECGCQAEIGSACAMAAAALGELFGLSIEQIEYAAEIALEHHLGLTCDPVDGLVQIPCIERNAVAAMRAINAVTLSNFLSDTRKISFDKIVHTMYETGLDMSGRYKETGQGGLAKWKIT